MYSPYRSSLQDTHFIISFTDAPTDHYKTAALESGDGYYTPLPLSGTDTPTYLYRHLLSCITISPLVCLTRYLCRQAEQTIAPSVLPKLSLLFPSLFIPLLVLQYMLFDFIFDTRYSIVLSGQQAQILLFTALSITGQQAPGIIPEPSKYLIQTEFPNHLRYRTFHRFVSVILDRRL